MNVSFSENFMILGNTLLGMGGHVAWCAHVVDRPDDSTQLWRAISNFQTPRFCKFVDTCPRRMKFGVGVVDVLENSSVVPNRGCGLRTLRDRGACAGKSREFAIRARNSSKTELPIPIRWEYSGGGRSL